MKSTSQDYLDAERSSERKPTELYEFWYGTTYYRWTSGDTTITYNTNDYTPKPITRSSMSFEIAFEVSNLNISIDFDTPLITTYKTDNPVGIVWVKVLKLFRDMSPYEVSTVFMGRIKNVSFRGGQASVSCVGLEELMERNAPTNYFQPACNNNLFDSNCGVNPDSWKTTTQVTLDSTGTILTSTDFGSNADGYYTRGWVTYGGHPRRVLSHIGNNITISWAIADLEDNDTVDAYAGCTQSLRTCIDKFNNKNNFFGMPFIPTDNPESRPLDETGQAVGNYGVIV
jgi:uncharacterized phage protein (TIGR02218 family)